MEGGEGGEGNGNADWQEERDVDGKPVTRGDQ